MRRVKPLIHISYRQSIAFAAFLVFYEFLTYISNDMIMPGMHQVIHDFHAGESNIASSVTAFMLGGSSLQLFLGPLADAYGRRRMMLIGVVVFLISTLYLSICPNMHLFLIGRFFQGMGICFIGAVGYATLQDIFNDTDAIKLTAIMANLSIIAPLLGPLLGAAIVYHGSWRFIFSIIGALTGFTFWGLWRFMPEPMGQINTDGKLIAKESFELKKMIQNYKTLLQNKYFLTTNIMYGLMSIPCMIWIALSPVMLISTEKNSLMVYGLWQIPMFSSFIFANTLLQKWIEKIGIERLLNGGTLIVISSLIMSLLSLMVFGLQVYSLIAIFVVYFFGYAIASAPIYRKLFSATGVSKGTTGALISLINMLIQSLGIEFGNIIFKGQHYLYLGYMFFSLGLIIAGLFVVMKKLSVQSTQ
jgi:DHA1 family multidrug/chloramphenicol efflux transport protein-like MFS transporter